MVQVAPASEIVARVGRTRYVVAVCLRVPTVVVGADVGQRPRHGLAVPFLCGEVAPVRIACSVVNHHVFYYSCSLTFKGFNHLAQFCFGAERA